MNRRQTVHPLEVPLVPLAAMWVTVFVGTIAGLEYGSRVWRRLTGR